MKSIINKLFLLAGIFFACVPLTNATTGNSVSSTTNVVGQPTLLLVRAKESVTYILTSTGGLTAGCTINLEASTNFANWVIQFTTATTSPGQFNTLTGVLAPVNQDTWYRWNVVATSAPVPVTLTLRDNDDFVSGMKSNKQLDSVYFNDDSLNVFGTLKPDRYQYQSASTISIVNVSSFTQFQWGPPVPMDKQWPFYTQTATNSIIMNTGYAVIKATGTDSVPLNNGITLGACPTITTDTSNNGDRVVFHCQSSSITFVDWTGGTVNGKSSALKLGSATRACGTGDTIGFLYLNGFWREEFFSNIISE